MAEENAAPGDLLDAGIAPLVRRVLARRLSGAATAADLEDLAAGVLLRLQVQLDAARRGEREAPRSLADYAAMAAHHAAAEHLAARQPERARLRDRIRYVLRREASLALWQGVEGEPLCGLAAARGEGGAALAPQGLLELGRRHLAEQGGGARQFPSVVREILAEARAVPLEALVEALAELLGVRDPAPVALDALAGDSAGALAAPAPPADRELAAREQLRALWVEIAALPAAQRFALLANLRGEPGAAPLETFLAAGAVAPAELAAALGCAPAGLEPLIAGFPCDDRWIAARLGLDRQQVANLRKAARLRLARRLRGVLPGLGR